MILVISKQNCDFGQKEHRSDVWDTGAIRV